jgi:CBS domain-containing protein
MTSDPRSIEASSSVADAAQLLRLEDVGSLPVVRDGHLVAMLTDRDIVVRVLAEGRDPQSTLVGEIASRDVESAAPEQDLEQALRLMARRQLRRLPVLEGDRLVGILAQADIAEAAPFERTGEVVERISR